MRCRNVRRQVPALLVLTAGVFSLAPCALMAADVASASTSKVPSWTDTLAAWGISASGYIAGSYYASNGYPVNIHQFDVEHDTFQLDQAGFAVAYQPKQGFGALVDLMAGEDARILHIAEDGHDESFDLRQAYIQYSSGALTLIGGKFVTLAGAEVINPTQNANFSRSLLFTLAEPLTHTGVRATFALSDTFSVIAGANNGWNTTSTSYGSKTGELGVAWTPSKTFSLAAQSYVGKFGATVPGLDGLRSLVDVVGTYNATSALTFIVNLDWDRQDQAFGPGTGSASWYGVAGYVNYAFNDEWRMSLRGEYLDDADGFLTSAAELPGYTGLTSAQHFSEGTVTFGYSPSKSFELRMEGRYDTAQTNLFLRSRALGTAPAEFADSLSQIALQGVYKFGT
ncbi:MAG TPA: outer membrane beta-barrel protein [Steroidobacteraceae bacterium]|nr:outer membrane beta-barrel protein [Steroidobacteraceae bacterium]